MTHSFLDQPPLPTSRTILLMTKVHSGSKSFSQLSTLSSLPRSHSRQKSITPTLMRRARCACLWSAQRTGSLPPKLTKVGLIAIPASAGKLMLHTHFMVWSRITSPCKEHGFGLDYSVKVLMQLLVPVPKHHFFSFFHQTGLANKLSGNVWFFKKTLTLTQISFKSGTIKVNLWILTMHSLLNFNVCCISEIYIPISILDIYTISCI